MGGKSRYKIDLVPDSETKTLPRLSPVALLQSRHARPVWNDKQNKGTFNRWRWHGSVNHGRNQKALTFRSSYDPMNLLDQEARIC